MKTFVDHLVSELDSIKLSIFELLENSRILPYRQNNSPIYRLATSKYYWDKPTEEEKVLQIEIKKNYGQWIKTFELFTEDLSDADKKKIEQVDKFIISWIEKKNEWGTYVPSSTSEAKTKFESKIQILYDTLELYSKASEKRIILVPDTNALIQEPEPKAYTSLSGQTSITIVFLPTVLSELDGLKVKSSNPNFQKKVKSVISRLKGYRRQGNMIEGVTVERTITLKMIASEPNFEKTFFWLDKDNNDDRIIASTLEIQKENPSSVVCIVTSDINLQNKAEMAKLSYLDID
ncbi:MAG: PIN domain-containing protein [Bacteroidota bacterium]